MNLNITSNNIKNFARTTISRMKKGDALLPVILLELAVTGGRTYHAYQRGGFVEARERGTEETLGAIFWIGGVQAFNKLGDAIGKKVLRLDDIEIKGDGIKKKRFGLEKIEFDAIDDYARKPMTNYIHNIKQQEKTLQSLNKKIPKITPNTIAIFKFTKVISSVLLSNAVIGFVVPKLNQAITRNYQNSIEKEKENKKLKEQNNFNSFINKTAGSTQKETSFKGVGFSRLLGVANSIENDTRYKLLSSDIGIAGGRAINARNKHERREALFRDLSSIYFYMFCKNHLDSLLNLITTGRSTRLDPTSVEILDKHLKEKLQLKDEPNSKKYSASAFEKEVFGTTATVPEKIQKEFGDKKIITLEKFKELSNNKKYNEIAEKMSKLQPQIEGVSILTSEQIKDVYTGGLINDPEMLDKVFNEYSKAKLKDKIGKSKNPMTYFSEDSLRSLKQRMHDYVGDIVKKAETKKKGIDFNTLKRANKANFIHNAFNLTAGFAVSAYFLSTAIPKIQYWITQRKTGQNSFPGIEKYDK